jgi:hypothetical protein
MLSEPRSRFRRVYRFPALERKCIQVGVRNAFIPTHTKFADSKSMVSRLHVRTAFLMMHLERWPQEDKPVSSMTPHTQCLWLEHS